MPEIGLRGWKLAIAPSASIDSLDRLSFSFSFSPLPSSEAAAAASFFFFFFFLSDFFFLSLLLVVLAGDAASVLDFLRFFTSEPFLGAFSPSPSLPPLVRSVIRPSSTDDWSSKSSSTDIPRGLRRVAPPSSTPFAPISVPSFGLSFRCWILRFFFSRNISPSS